MLTTPSFEERRGPAVVERPYRNVGFLLLVLIALVAGGFYIPYFSELPNPGTHFSTVVHVHAAALVSWVVLLVVQPLLIRYRRFRAHRLLGKVSYGLISVVLASSLGVLAQQYREGMLQKMSPIADLLSLSTSIGELILFASFYFLAIVYRHRLPEHMRYMLCSALVLISPSLARVLGFWFGVELFPSLLTTFLLIDFLLVGLILFDGSRRLGSKPYVVALAMCLAFHVTWMLLGHPT